MSARTGVGGARGGDGSKRGSGGGDGGGGVVGSAHEPLRLSRMRQVLSAHLQAWRKRMPADAVMSAYPFFKPRDAAYVNTLMGVFWTNLADNVQLEFEDLCKTEGVVTKLAALEAAMAESASRSGGSIRPVPSTTDPADAVRQGVVEAKREHLRYLEATLAASRTRNAELEAEVNKLDARGRAVKTALAARMAAIMAAAEACSSVAGGEGTGAE